MSFGYGRSIDEGLKCLAAHKSKIETIEVKLAQSPICTMQPNRWILRYGPRVFAALFIVGLGLGLLLLALSSAVSSILWLAAGQ